MRIAFKCAMPFAVCTAGMSACPFEVGAEGGAVIGGKGNAGAEQPVVAGFSACGVVEVEAVATREGKNNGINGFIAVNTHIP